MLRQKRSLCCSLSTPAELKGYIGESVRSLSVSRMYYKTFESDKRATCFHFVMCISENVIIFSSSGAEVRRGDLAGDSALNWE